MKMSDVILHHYPTSPYSEKVRIAFGIKDLAWRSVTIPVVMPKPDLMPLTGGYRKTPVMQIGADIYCDTQLILREIERRFPEPPLYPPGAGAPAEGLGWWIERSLFSVAVGVLFAKVGGSLPKPFLDDRAKFSGREINPERMAAADPMLRDSLRAQLSWLEAALGAQQGFILGDRPSVADCSVYHMVWFIQRARGDLFDEFPHVARWATRMAAFGHGTPTPLEAADALAIAKAAEPSTKEAVDPGDPVARTPGQKVAVTPDDTGRDPVTGVLIASSPTEIVIRRSDPAVGEIDVHFPRAGFVVAPAAS
jgi:glutathione S-transferase